MSRLRGQYRNTESYRRSVLQYIFVIAITFAVAQLITGLSSGFSIGRMMKLLLPVVGLTGLMAILLTGNSGELLRLSTIPIVKRWHVVLIILVPLVFALAIISVGSTISLTYSLVGLLVVVGIVATGYFTLTRDDVYGLAVFLLTLPFLSFLEWDFRKTLMGSWQWGFLVLSPSIVLLWVLSFLTVMRQRIRHKKLAHGPLAKYILLWGIFLFVSSVFSRDPSVSFGHFVLEVFVFPLFYFLVVNRVRSRRDAVLLCWAICAYGLLRLLVIHYFYILGMPSGYPLWFSADSPNIHGLVPHPGIINSIVGWIFPLSVIFFLITRKYPIKIILIIAACFSLYLSIGTGGRGNFIGLIIASLAIMFVSKPLKLLRRLALAGGIGLMFIILLNIPSAQLLTEKLSEWHSLESLFYEQAMRWDSWKAALRMMYDYPVSGIGMGMWDYFIPQYTEKTFYWGNRIFQTNSAHHLFLLYGSAGGIGALLVMIFFIGHTCAKGLRFIREGKHESMAILGSGLLWGLLAFVISGCLGAGGFFEFVPGSSEDVCTILDVGMFPWLAMGLLVVLKEVSNREEAV